MQKEYARYPGVLCSGFVEARLTPLAPACSSHYPGAGCSGFVEVASTTPATPSPVVIPERVVPVSLKAVVVDVRGDQGRYPGAGCSGFVEVSGAYEMPT